MPLSEIIGPPIPGERLDLVPLGHCVRESVILLQTKDTLLMYRTPVTITNGTQRDRLLVLISQAG